MSSRVGIGVQLGSQDSSSWNSLYKANFLSTLIAAATTIAIESSLGGRSRCGRLFTFMQLRVLLLFLYFADFWSLFVEKRFRVMQCQHRVLCGAVELWLWSCGCGVVDVEL